MEGEGRREWEKEGREGVRDEEGQRRGREWEEGRGEGGMRVYTQILLLLRPLATSQLCQPVPAAGGNKPTCLVMHFTAGRESPL